MAIEQGPPLAYSTAGAAGILGVSAGTVRRWTDQGQLECRRTPGGQRRFSREDLDEFVAQLKARVADVEPYPDSSVY